MEELPEDREVFHALEEYLERLQTGQPRDRDSLLCRYPQLASALDCLEVLDDFAPMAGSYASGEHDTIEVHPIGSLPQEFGDYELIGEIGRGGMGVVYKARQKALDRTVAIKMILAGHLASPEYLRRFQAEARAAARVSHSNIVHIHEVGQLRGQHFFVMEYVEGSNLAERIAAGPVEIKTAVRLVASVARAVDHLHQQGIIHRDLKPSNILLDARGEPYVTDFGLAKVFSPGSQTTSTGVIAGTPSYMAPEQASGRSEPLGPPCDVYSLGTLLYELLTGRPPFCEESPFDTLVQVLQHEPTLPRRLNPRVPRELEMICLRCLEKSPGDRYPSAAALADDLEHFSKGEALEIKSPDLTQRIGRWARRQPALASRLGGLGIFYGVEVFNYSMGIVDRSFHLKISVLLAIWAAASIGFQQLLDSKRWSVPARFVWGMLDSLVFLAVLLVADGVASPLVVGYPLLIVASALWFRVRFVWFMTLLSLLSYGVLVLDFYNRRVELQQHFPTKTDRHVIFAVAMTVLGVAVAYLVQRVRALSSFSDRKP
jgi:serine/threonine protein kinase